MLLINPMRMHREPVAKGSTLHLRASLPVMGAVLRIGTEWHEHPPEPGSDHSRVKLLQASFLFQLDLQGCF